MTTSFAKPFCFPILMPVIVFAMALTLPAQRLMAQNGQDSNWHAHAESRLKAIYERGDFRGKNIRPNWLDDSSGVTIEDVDPITKEPVTWLVDVRTGERRVLSSDAKDSPSLSGNNSKSDYVRIESRNGALVSINPQSGEELVLVSKPTDRDVVYRNSSLSPDGTKVLFVEADYTDVRQRSVLIPGDPSYPDVHQNRFARIGGAIEKLRIGVVSSQGKQLAWLSVDAPPEGFYLGQVEWANNSETVLVEKFSRFRDKRDFFLMNTTSGHSIKIFSESDSAWVESSQGKNSGLVWIRDGQAFVVISEKDGWRHAYVYSRDGAEIAKLTPGEFDIIERGVIDQRQGWYYYYASPHDGTQKYLYRAKLDGAGESQRVTPDDQVGTHAYLFSPDAKWAVHTFSTIDTPPLHELIEVEGHRVVCKLEDNSSIRERMKSIATRPTEFLKLNIGNGVEMDAWMIRPANFDASKKYPIVVYVYGEPHAQTVLNEWGISHIDFHRLVAENGYVVVSIDNRGTPCPKGAAWRRSIFGSLGPLSTEEQEAGLKALAKECPFIDLSRVGIWGWSGGGSNTLNALFRKPESYHVGVAVVPKPQPHLYNAWFQEIFMRTPEVNPDGYQRSAPIHYAEGLKGRLLIITGSGETNTHIQIIEGLVDKLIALGKPFDYMVYPNRDHGLREGEGTSVHVRMLILRYFKENLPSDHAMSFR